MEKAWPVGREGEEETAESATQVTPVIDTNAEVEAGEEAESTTESEEGFIRACCSLESLTLGTTSSGTDG